MLNNFRLPAHMNSKADCVMVDGFPVPNNLVLRVRHYRLTSQSPQPFRYFRSKRAFAYDGGLALKPENFGGYTVVSIEDKRTGRAVAASAHCSLTDQFCYTTGRKLAFWRAITSKFEFKVSYTRGIDDEHNLSPFGGFTKATIVHDGQMYSGIAVCSVKDQFNKKTGRELAMFRAVMAYLMDVALYAPEYGGVKIRAFILYKSGDVREPEVAVESNDLSQEEAALLGADPDNSDGGM